MCQLSFDSQSASQRCQNECSLVLKCSSSSSSRPVTVVINKVSRAGKRRALFTTVYVKLLTGCSASVMRLCCCCQAAAPGGATVSSLLLSVLALASSRRLPPRWLRTAKKAGRSRQDNSCIVHTHTHTHRYTDTHTHTEKLARCNVLAAADCEVKIDTQY